VFMSHCIVAAATMQWDMNTDPVQAAKSGKVLGRVVSASGESVNAGSESDGVDLVAQASAGSASSAGAKPEDGVTPSAPPSAQAVPVPVDKDPHGYYEARARREQFQSKQAELDYLQALGELVSSSDMRRISARRYRAMRDKLLNIPDRLAAVLAAEREPAQVHAVLTADIKRVLNELSDDASAELAAGVAERVAA
jgi:hypothetical protein